jgi:hypothetical protein
MLGCARSQRVKEQGEKDKAPSSTPQPQAAEAPSAPTVSPPPAAEPGAASAEHEDDLSAPADLEEKADRGPSSVAPRKSSAKPSAKKKERSSSSSGEGRGGIGTTEDEPASARVQAAFDEIETAFGSLDGALTLSTPDCAGARRFGERICSLSDEICRLAEASSNPEELALCVDGRQRCGEARRRLAARCE